MAANVYSDHVRKWTRLQAVEIDQAGYARTDQADRLSAPRPSSARRISLYWPALGHSRPSQPTEQAAFRPGVIAADGGAPLALYIHGRSSPNALVATLTALSGTSVDQGPRGATPSCADLAYEGGTRPPTVALTSIFFGGGLRPRSCRPPPFAALLEAAERPLGASHPESVHVTALPPRRGGTLRADIARPGVNRILARTPVAGRRRGAAFPRSRA